MSQSTNLSQMNTVATAPATKSSQIPDLLKIGAMPSDTSMDVLTDILDPVVQNDGYVRFAFQNKGILHSHSKLQLAVNNNGLAHDCLFPIHTGVYNLVERVRFSIGSKTVSEIEDFNFFMAYKSIFLSQEAMREREQYLTSRIMNFGFEYTDRVTDADDKYMWGWEASNPNNATLTAGKIAPGNSQAEFLTIDNGVDAGIPTQQDGVADGVTGITQFLNKTATGGVGVADGTGRPIYKAGYFADLKRTDAETCPTFQLSLSDLVPFLKTQQIPLYMLDELVTLEIFFTKQADRVIAPGNTVDAVVNATIKQSETKMIADYLFYPNEMMVSYANANRNLQFNYPDYRLSKYSISDATTDRMVRTEQLIRNVGGAGRMINRLFFGINSIDKQYSQKEPATKVGDLYTGNTGALAPMRDYTNGVDAASLNGVATINLKYNDNFIFPIDVTNSARHFHNTADAEQVTPSCIPRECYSMEGQLITTGSLNCSTSTATYTGPPARQQLSSLGGQFFYAGLKLQPGERVNSRGIELYLKWSDSGVRTGGQGYVQRVWLETVRSLQLQNGRVSITFA